MKPLQSKVVLYKECKHKWKKGKKRLNGDIRLVCLHCGDIKWTVKKEIKK